MPDITTIDPTTGRVLERFDHHRDDEIERRLAAVARAADVWRETAASDRAAVLRAVGARLRAERDSLAMTAVREMGKPLAQARGEVEKCAWCCDYFADNGAAMLAEREMPSGAAHSYVAFAPLGTILAIMPWNFPYWQLFRAAAPTLMAGNAILLKHADNTSRCSLEIERIFLQAGAPASLVTTLLVSNERTDELIADDRIAAVTLTGSERAGVAVGAAAGRALKKCVLELGGSDPFVVLHDADVGDAVTKAVDARFQNNGQSCIAAKRFILDRAIHDEFLERFTAVTSARAVGDPKEGHTQIGPLARADLRDALDRQVRQSVSAGARLVLGGKPIDRPGFFYEPTIVAGVEPGMPMFDQEVFGPAAAVAIADDEDDAIRLANASTFGLGASLWTRDVARAQRLAARVQAGSVFINGIVASDPRLPFGGIKKSGHGRELSAFGIAEFTNIQTIWIGPAK